MTKKTNRLKTEAIDHYVAQSREDVNAAIAEIGRCQRERARIEAEMNDNLATIRAEYEKAAKPHADRIADLQHGIHVWCEANRQDLTREGKTKTARFASGEVAWRTRPPSVRLTAAADVVIKALKALGLSRFIRTKEELDREAVLKEPAAVEAVRGISISQREDFVVTPDETKLEEVQ
jgi:phage host-nuclease inhibitor protein Gam